MHLTISKWPGMGGLILTLAFVMQSTASAQEVSSITTSKNGQVIGVRKVTGDELRNSAVVLSTAFQERAPTYEHLLNVAKGMNAKDRCFNLFSSKVTLASIAAGKLDASQNAEAFLKGSISSLEAVNSQTQVKCTFEGLAAPSISPRPSKVQLAGGQPGSPSVDTGKRQECFLISGTISIVPTWRDNNVPLSRAHENVAKVLARTSANESEKQNWREAVSAIYGSQITSAEVEQQIRPTCVNMVETK